jgi:hypothetical protein
MMGAGGKRARRDGDGLCLYIYALIWLFVWFEKIKTGLKTVTDLYRIKRMGADYSGEERYNS